MRKFIATLTAVALAAALTIVFAPVAHRPVQAQQFATCLANTATPENCASACEGYFTVSAATVTTVNTTCVTATSRIFLSEDSSIGSQLPSAPTCAAAVVAVAVTSRSAGLSFTVTPASTFTTNGCIAFRVSQQQ